MPTEIWSSLLGEGGRQEGRKAGRKAGRMEGRKEEVTLISSRDAHLAGGGKIVILQDQMASAFGLMMQCLPNADTLYKWVKSSYCPETSQTRRNKAINTIHLRECSSRISQHITKY